MVENNPTQAAQGVDPRALSGLWQAVSWAAGSNQVIHLAMVGPATQALVVFSAVFWEEAVNHRTSNQGTADPVATVPEVRADC